MNLVAKMNGREIKLNLRDNVLEQKLSVEEIAAKMQESLERSPHRRKVNGFMFMRRKIELEKVELVNGVINIKGKDKQNIEIIHISQSNLCDLFDYSWE